MAQARKHMVETVKRVAATLLAHEARRAKREAKQREAASKRKPSASRSRSGKQGVRERGAEEADIARDDPRLVRLLANSRRTAKQRGEAAVAAHDAGARR